MDDEDDKCSDCKGCCSGCGKEIDEDEEREFGEWWGKMEFASDIISQRVIEDFRDETDARAAIGMAYAKVAIREGLTKEEIVKALKSLENLFDGLEVVSNPELN